MPVEVSAHSTQWAFEFVAEAAALRAALGHTALALHHIGSTAIAGIAAKPVIDMLLEVPSLEALDAATPHVQALGYEAMGEFGIAGRRYFRRTTAAGVRTHQLHAFARGSSVGGPEIERHLAFCRYMNTHPDAAQAYSSLKLNLAAAHPNDMNAYMDGKDTFVKHHEALALTWAKNLSV